jgi:hypothetical protein
MLKKSTFSKRTVLVAAERVRTSCSSTRAVACSARTEKTRDEIDRAFRAASKTVRGTGEK